MPAITAQPSVGVVSNRGNTLSIEVDYFEVEKLYDMVIERVSGFNLYDFLVKEGHPYFSGEIAKRFAHQGDAKSGKWAPLEDATQDIRTAMGVPGPAPINIRSGLLGNRDSLFDFVTEHYEANYGKDWAELQIPGTPDPVQQAKLETAQQGSTGNPLGYGDTPARPVLADDTDEDLQALMERLQGFIMLEVSGALL